ncbi:MAG: Cys-tRNA(Pro) deacylase [Clostridiales bacterium]|nr:Cys-tRNA(Pro) deacylase [Clostridiales bacterium]
MSKKEEKTNVMRALDRAKIQYTHRNYEPDGKLTGAEIAAALGENPQSVFKTLVTVSKSNEHYVFMIPVEKELDLKKCAKAVDEKSVEMIPQKDLLPVTGYVHGGCSPIGMKKQFKTTIDSSAENFEKIMFSAGKIGCQVELKLCDLKKLLEFQKPI